MSKSYTFNTVPTLRRKRSKFPMGYTHQTTMNVGTLYPVYLQEIYPGDEFKCNARFVSRVSSTFLRPVTDNLFVDTAFFFVPARLVYEKWQNIFGENTDSAWADPQLHSVPAFPGIGTSQIAIGGVLDVLYGMPKMQVTPGVSVLPARAFALIYDQWYRNQATDPPMHIQKGDFNNNNETPRDAPWTPQFYVGRLPKATKIRDYFTSALPAPQKGPAVGLPIGNIAPVEVRDEMIPAGPVPSTGVKWNSTNGSIGLAGRLVGLDESGTEPNYPVMKAGGAATGLQPGELFPLNLWADLSEASSIAVNDFRMAVQLQKMLERDARSGTRYTEYIEAAFGVNNPDSRLQRPEYIYGFRSPLTIQQVSQTSQSTEDSPLGNVAGYSWSNGSGRWRKAFTEHGFVIGCSVIRYKHTYQQGVERFLWRSTRTDFYDPVFQNIGEQPIYKREIYSPGGLAVLGYQEAWADLRYRPNRVSNQMRSYAPASLDIYHFADVYSSAPVLNQSFMEETPVFVDRTLAVPSTSQDNFLVDFYFDQVGIRELPVYSVPGFVDHH